MTTKRSRLTQWLESASTPAFMSFAVGSSFMAYFCMYAFRKPFSAATYENLTFRMDYLDISVDLKTAFVVSQILGYALSKVIGTKLCSELARERRAIGLVLMIVIAQVALLLFAVLPNNLKVIAIFANGLPLGMVWGMVVWYLEGRRTSEMLLAGLSCSYILAGGVVKDVGLLLMTPRFGVDQFWMPFAVGLIFLPPFFLSVWLLNKVPQPDAEDVRQRVERRTMDGHDRWVFVKQFFPGLLMLLVAYFCLTAYRDFRDFFGREIFEQLGYGKSENLIFTRCEVLVAFGVLGALAALNLIKNNWYGLVGAFCIMAFGTALLGIGTLLYDAKMISGLTWMILCGLGLYLAYVPYGSVLFDRLIASTGAVGTAVFAIYVADAIGYAGAISVMLGKDTFAAGVSRLEFFRSLTYFMCLLGTVMLFFSCWYFLSQHKGRSSSREGGANDAVGNSSDR